MREIRVRAWDTVEKKMTPAMPFFMACGYFAASASQGQDLRRFVVMEFSGLIDRHGKEVYVGDICRQRYGTKIIVAPVIFHEERAQFGLGLELEEESYLPEHVEVHVLTMNNAPEVIGDIYRNPELLKNN